VAGALRAPANLPKSPGALYYYVATVRVCVVRHKAGQKCRSPSQARGKGCGTYQTAGVNGLHRRTYSVRLLASLMRSSPVVLLYSQPPAAVTSPAPIAALLPVMVTTLFVPVIVSSGMAEMYGP
jgi:hypothetical protein